MNRPASPSCHRHAALKTCDWPPCKMISQATRANRRVARTEFSRPRVSQLAIRGRRLPKSSERNGWGGVDAFPDIQFRNIQWDATSRAGTYPRLGCRFLLRACRVSLDYAACLGIAATSRTTSLAPGSGPVRLMPLLERQSSNGPHYRAPNVITSTLTGRGVTAPLRRISMLGSSRDGHTRSVPFPPSSLWTPSVPVLPESSIPRPKCTTASGHPAPKVASWISVERSIYRYYLQIDITVEHALPTPRSTSRHSFRVA